MALGGNASATSSIGLLSVALIGPQGYARVWGSLTVITALSPSACGGQNGRMTLGNDFQVTVAPVVKRLHRCCHIDEVVLDAAGST